MRSIAGVNLRTCSGEHMYRYAMCKKEDVNYIVQTMSKVSEKNFRKNLYPIPPPGRPAEGRYFGTFDPPLQWGPGRGVCDNNVARDIESRDRVDGRPPGNET